MDPTILQSDIESEAKQLQTLQREMQKHIETRQKLIEQQSECDLVKKEIDLLESDAKIFKLEGPLLVAQTLNESKGNIKSRLEKITNNLNITELNIRDNESKQTQRRNQIVKLQESYYKAIAPPQQQQQQPVYGPAPPVKK